MLPLLEISIPQSDSRAQVTSSFFAFFLRSDGMILPALLALSKRLYGIEKITLLATIVAKGVENYLCL